MEDSICISTGKYTVLSSFSSCVMRIVPYPIYPHDYELIINEMSKRIKTLENEIKNMANKNMG